MQTPMSTCSKPPCFPGLKQIEGYRGGYVLRNNTSTEVEFVVINLFDSLNSVKRFAGPNYKVAVLEPEARRLLSRIEPRAHHYEIVEIVASPL